MKLIKKSFARPEVLFLLFVAIVLVTITLTTFQRRAEAQSFSQFVAQPLANFVYTPTNVSAVQATNASGAYIFNVSPASAKYATNYTQGLGYAGWSNEASFSIRPGYGVAIGFLITNHSADIGSNVTIGLNLSPDGINGSSLTNFTFTFTLLATSNFFTTNIPWNTNLDGQQAIGLMALSNWTANACGESLEFARGFPWKQTATGL